MITEEKPLAEITQDALRILYREIGVVNTVRFFNQFTTGYGNYTEERREFFTDLTLDELLEEIEQRQREG